MESLGWPQWRHEGQAHAHERPSPRSDEGRVQRRSIRAVLCQMAQYVRVTGYSCNRFRLAPARERTARIALDLPITTGKSDYHVWLCGPEDMAEDPESILYKPFEIPELGRRLRSVLDDGSTHGARHLDPAQIEGRYP